MLVSHVIYAIDFTYVFEVNDVTNVSTIDYHVWNSSAHDSVIDAGVYIYQTTPQFILPCFGKMNSDMVTKHSSQANPAKTNINPCWKPASDLGSIMNCRLQSLDVPSV